MTELDEVADALYAGSPSAFIEHRDAAAKAARSAGERDLAQQISELRKPTVSAWLVNLLVRDDPGFADRLVALGAALRDAERTLDGPVLRELSTQRRQLVRSLTARARALAKPSGQRVGDAVAQELDTTLTAALADPAVARQVTSGRLTAAREYAGFGGADAGSGELAPALGDAVPTPPREQPNATPRSAHAPSPGPAPTLTLVPRIGESATDPRAVREAAADHERRARAEERERRAREEASAARDVADRAVAEARRALTAAQESRDESAAELARAQAAATEAHADEDDLVRALAEARRRLAAAGKAAIAADRDVGNAQQNLRHDDRAIAVAERDLRRAERTRAAAAAPPDRGTP